MTGVMPFALESRLPSADPVMARYARRYLDAMISRPDMTLADKVHRERSGETFSAQTPPGDVHSVGRAPLGPVFHQLSPPFEHITAPICRFHSVANRMTERHFGQRICV